MKSSQLALPALDMVPGQVVRGRQNPLHWKFSERLKRARREKNLTADNLSVAAGVSNSAVSHLEAGARLPHLPTLERIANALHVSPGWLAFGADSPFEPLDGLRCSLLAERLRVARNERGWSLRELDRQAGVAVGASRSIEAGGMPTLDTIELVAKALQVSPAWLAFGVGSAEGKARRRANAQLSGQTL